MELFFRHPEVKKSPLVVNVGMEEIAWAYRLNVAEKPTYGGEVVQILSVAIDDLAIDGQVRTYEEMESIYAFFVEYLTIASQGTQGVGSYNQQFMTFEYPHRGWSMIIQPLAVPNFTYSRETVAPTWSLNAHVVDETPGNYMSLSNMLVTTIRKPHTHESAKEEEELFKTEGIISLASESPELNPFSAPVPASKKANPGQEFQPYRETGVKSKIKEYADWYNKLIPSYTKGEYNSLLNSVSKPAFGKPPNSEQWEKIQEEAAESEEEFSTKKKAKSKKK